MCLFSSSNRRDKNSQTTGVQILSSVYLKETEAMITNCRFCTSILSSSKLGQGNNYDTILFESENFVATPTIGALVEGWLLVIPRQHFLSMANLPVYLLNELNDFRMRVAREIEFHYGPVTVVEHGPSNPSSAVSCGVDHAHFHLVPLEFDVLVKISTILPSIEWRKIDAFQQTIPLHQQGLDYLYVEVSDSCAYVATSKQFPSQLLRRAVAEHLGCPNQFDWRKYVDGTSMEILTN
jgi:ATP adenylyltransferase